MLTSFKCCGSRDKDDGDNERKSARNSHLKSIFRQSLNPTPSTGLGLAIEKVIEKQAAGEEIAIVDEEKPQERTGMSPRETLKSYRLSAIQVEEVMESDNSSVDSELQREIEEARDAFSKQKKDRRREDRKTVGGRITTGDTYGSSRDTVVPFARADSTGFGRSDSMDNLDEQPSSTAWGRQDSADLGDDIVRRSATGLSTDSSALSATMGETEEDKYEDVQDRVSQLRTSLRLSSVRGSLKRSSFDLDPIAAVLKVKDRITKAYMEEEQQNENITQDRRELLQTRISVLQADPDKVGE